MTGIAARLVRSATLVTLLIGCSAIAASPVAAQDFIAVIDQDEGPMMVRLVGCGPACKVMRFDDAQGTSSTFIELRMHEGGVMDGRFSFVDHGAKTIDVLEFTDPSLADYVFGAQAARAGALESMMDALLGRSDVQATGERRTFTVRDFDSGEDIELEAEEYTFEFEYETEGMPGLAQMSEEQRSQLPDIKLGMTSSGATWVAPGAPGAADLAQFYVAMGAAFQQYTLGLAGGDGEQADLTASMVSNMARIAALGLPVRTTTRVEIKPVVGGAGGAMAEMFMRMMPIPEIPPTTSQVRGLGVDPAIAMGPDFADAFKWGWGSGGPTDRAGYEPEGYEVRDLVAAGGG